VEVTRFERRFTIPRGLVEAFSREPRFLLKESPIGLWPVDPGFLQQSGMLERFVQDEEFVKNFEIVIMPKG
jgi:hypothetical protein